jgi:hypothetical protein
MQVKGEGSAASMDNNFMYGPWGPNTIELYAVQRTSTEKVLRISQVYFSDAEFREIVAEISPLKARSVHEERII